MATIQIVPHLTKEELLKAFKQEKDARVSQRIHIILCGYETNYYPRVNEIMKFFKISNATVYKWINRWNEDGLEGLQIKKAKGRDPILTIDEKNQHINLICRNPRESGFDFSSWTLNMQANHILEEFGKTISISAISRMLKKNNIVQIVPRTLPAKGDPKKKKSLKKS